MALAGSALPLGQRNPIRTCAKPQPRGVCAGRMLMASNASYNTDACAPQSPPATDEILGNIQDIQSFVGEAIGSLVQLHGRSFGNAPESPEANKLQPVQSGSFGSIAERLQELRIQALNARDLASTLNSRI